MMEPETNAAQRQWVKTVRIIIAFCMLGWFPVIWSSGPVTLIFWIPYLLALLLLSTKFLKTGLVFSLLVLPLFAFAFGGLSFLGALAHLALVFSVLRRARGHQTKALGTVKVLIVGFVFVSLFAGLVYIAIPSTACIVEETPIDTPSGSRRIEDLTVGDEVWTQAPSGELQIGRVHAIYASWSVAQHMIALSDGTILNATAQHPVATSADWKSVGQLKAGDSVRSLDGQRTVTSIRRTNTLVRVFDLEVQPNSNFFANGVLVHNKSPGPRNPIVTELSARQSLRSIVYGQIQYAAETGEGSYATNLVELAKADLIDAVLASGAKDYYSFFLSTGADKTTFVVSARPLEYGTTGNLSFYMNESGVIRYTAEDRPATAEDPYQ